MSLGTKIRELRQDMGWSQQKLADKAGVASSYVSLLERDGRHSPSADVLLRLAKALKVEVDELYQAAGYIEERSEGEKRQGYLKVLPLLSPEHQHILEVLVRDFAKIERGQGESTERYL